MVTTPHSPNPRKTHENNFNQKLINSLIAKKIKMEHQLSKESEDLRHYIDKLKAHQTECMRRMRETHSMAIQELTKQLISLDKRNQELELICKAQQSELKSNQTQFLGNYLKKYFLILVVSFGISQFLCF